MSLNRQKMVFQDSVLDARDKKMSSKQTLTWRKGKYRLITIVIYWHEAKHSAYFCEYLMFLSFSIQFSW